MYLTHDSELALAGAAALVNSATTDDGDQLTTPADLDRFLERFPSTGVRLGTTEELAAVRRLRSRLRELWWVTDREEAAQLINDLLADADAAPYLSKHDQWDWHLHVTRPEASLAHRIGAEAAMGFLDLVREDQLGRLRRCGADDCDDVYVDLSRNSSRQFCSVTCGNRTNAAAYRARKRGERRAGAPPR
jgi:predicted RNA-binding Zn ribbon-like protein